MIERFMQKVDKKENGCWEWKGWIYKNGYGGFSIKGRAVLAHRASCIIFKKDLDSSLLVLHKCDNRSCVNPEHLFYGTNKDNTQDMIKKGRRASTRGEKSGRAILSIEAVKEIRSAKKEHGYINKLAQKFSVSRPTIESVLYGHNWREL